MGALERGKVDKLLCELANVMRDILMVKLRADKITMTSSQSQEKIEKWASFFSKGTIGPIIEQVIEAKSFINRNVNMKLAIDLLVKTIEKFKLKNN